MSVARRHPMSWAFNMSNTLIFCSNQVTTTRYRSQKNVPTIWYWVSLFSLQVLNVTRKRIALFCLPSSTHAIYYTQAHTHINMYIPSHILTHTQSVEFDISSSQDPDACIDTNEGRRKRHKASVALRSILVWTYPQNIAHWTISYYTHYTLLTGKILYNQSHNCYHECITDIQSCDIVDFEVCFDPGGHLGTSGRWVWSWPHAWRWVATVFSWNDSCSMKCVLPRTASDLPESFLSSFHPSCPPLTNKLWNILQSSFSCMVHLLILCQIGLGEHCRHLCVCMCVSTGKYCQVLCILGLHM